MKINEIWAASPSPTKKILGIWSNKSKCYQNWKWKNVKRMISDNDNDNDKW